eukprot:scaffold222889_cov38-Prasinocladus_malaysianus.AAC.2
MPSLSESMHQPVSQPIQSYVKAYLLPDIVTAQAELFLINGDLQAMFYTASRAMHSQSICLLEGKRNRMNRNSGMGAAINAGLAVQRRFINLVQVGPNVIRPINAMPAVE